MEKVYDSFMEAFDTVGNEIYSSAQNAADLRKEVVLLKTTYDSGIQVNPSCKDY